MTLGHKMKLLILIYRRERVLICLVKGETLNTVSVLKSFEVALVIGDDF